MAKNRPNTENRIRDAKRLFLVNLALFVCLIIGWMLISNDDKERGKPILTEPTKLIQLSNLELASLKGAMQALSEHPSTLPEYEKLWVLKASRRAIEQDSRFRDFDTTELIELTDAYFEAYTKHFNDYYESRSAQEAGYKLGLKFDPEIHGLYPKKTWGLLKKHRTKLEEQFYIQSEAEWRLFCKAFNNGFKQSYHITTEGVTVQFQYNESELFED